MAESRSRHPSPTLVFLMLGFVVVVLCLLMLLGLFGVASGFLTVVPVVVLSAAVLFYAATYVFRARTETP